jgi:hypothetical protein
VRSAGVVCMFGRGPGGGAARCSHGAAVAWVPVRPYAEGKQKVHSVQCARLADVSSRTTGPFLNNWPWLTRCPGCPRAAMLSCRNDRPIRLRYGEATGAGFQLSNRGTLVTARGGCAQRERRLGGGIHSLRGEFLQHAASPRCRSGRRSGSPSRRWRASAADDVAHIETRPGLAALGPLGLRFPIPRR